MTCLLGLILPKVLDIALGPPGDPVIEKDTVGGQKITHLLEITIIIGDAHMLVHADTGNLVKFALDRHVIAQFDFDPIG